jgi:hypothetical protein
MSLLWSF